MEHIKISSYKKNIIKSKIFQMKKKKQTKKTNLSFLNNKNKTSSNSFQKNYPNNIKKKFSKIELSKTAYNFDFIKKFNAKQAKKAIIIEEKIKENEILGKSLKRCIQKSGFLNNSYNTMVDNLLQQYYDKGYKIPHFSINKNIFTRNILLYKEDPHFESIYLGLNNNNFYLNCYKPKYLDYLNKLKICSYLHKHPKSTVIEQDKEVNENNNISSEKNKEIEDNVIQKLLTDIDSIKNLIDLSKKMRKSTKLEKKKSLPISQDIKSNSVSNIRNIKINRHLSHKIKLKKSLINYVNNKIKLNTENNSPFNMITTLNKKNFICSRNGKIGVSDTERIYNELSSSHDYTKIKNIDNDYMKNLKSKKEATNCRNYDEFFNSTVKNVQNIKSIILNRDLEKTHEKYLNREKVVPESYINNLKTFQDVSNKCKNIDKLLIHSFLNKG